MGGDVVGVTVGVGEGVKVAVGETIDVGVADGVASCALACVAKTTHTTNASKTLAYRFLKPGILSSLIIEKINCNSVSRL